MTQVQAARINADRKEWFEKEELYFVNLVENVVHFVVSFFYHKEYKKITKGHKEI